MEFTRQPRLMPDYQRGEIDVEPAPGEAHKPEVSWFQVLIMPVCMITLTVIAFMFGQSSGAGFMSNPIFLVSSAGAMVLSIIGSLINYNSQTRKFRLDKKTRESRYRRYIKDIDAQLATAAKQQTDALHKIHPPPVMCLDLMKKGAPTLWERTQGYEDFLVLRVGQGAAKTSWRVSASSAKPPGIMNTDPLAGEPAALAQKYDRINDVPICVDFRAAQIVGLAGQPQACADMLNNMLIQLVTHHGYDDVRLVLLAREEVILQWGQMRFIPHLWNDDFTVRYMYCTPDMARTALAELNALFKERGRKAEKGDVGFGSGPFYLFIVEDAQIIEEAQIRKYLYEPNIKLGVAAVFVAQQTSYLPMACNTIITIKEKTAQKTDRHTNEITTFIPDAPLYDGIEEGARKVAAYRIRQISSSYALPKAITLVQTLQNARLMQGEDITTVDVQSAWSKNRTYNGMSVPIGAGMGGISGAAVFNLDLHETGHGPHGLVAGTTGSGKSELLQSIIISFALNFHPYDVSFVLIDYKGGGMADVFTGMPHLAGVITNLSGRQTMRALQSIKGEILRRQTVFAKYGVNNIDKYQRLYYRRETPDMPPVSHLILIADEFAELKQDQPEFMKELVSAARVGRSLGIHLILATQKPDGVVDDQIWSNSKFKLCLKVQTEADSNGVLKKPDAAFIKLPGRAYLQVGNDEIYEMFQSAYSGADYNPDKIAAAAKAQKNLYTLSLDGKPSQIYPPAGADKPEEEYRAPSQLEVMVRHINDTFTEPVLAGPWTPPLEECIYLNDFDVAKKPENSLLSAMTALVDDPRGQRKFPLELDFAQDGNLIVYGMPASGKSSLLRAICLSLALRYTPREVNIYILDMNGTGFKALEKLPHCGGVLTIENATPIRQFIRFIGNTIAARKKAFDDNDLESFADYRRTQPHPMPAVLIMVDNYLGLAETYEDVDEQVQNMVREASKYGIYFIITALSDYGIRYKMQINFKMVIAFAMVDKSGYNNLVGRTDGLEPEDYPGRGLVKLSAPYEMQAFLPEYKKGDVITETKDIIEQIAAKTAERAVPIPIMPERISLKKLNETNLTAARGSTQTPSSTIAIGLSDADLTPVVIDLSQFASLIITGEPGCGKSSLAAAWVNELPNTVVYYLDSNALGLMDIANSEHTTDITTLEMEEFLSKMNEIITERREALNNLRRDAGDIKALVASWRQIIFLFDAYSEFSDNYDYDEFKDLLIRLITKERGLKLTVIALDTTDAFNSNYDNSAKVIKKEQTGVLLGSIKEQDLFDTRIPYGTTEKEIMFADGYLIKKNQMLGFRAGF